MTTVKLSMSLTVFLYILMIMHKIDLKVEKRREKLQYMSLKCPCNVIKKMTDISTNQSDYQDI